MKHGFDRSRLVISVPFGSGGHKSGSNKTTGKWDFAILMGDVLIYEILNKYIFEIC